MNVIEILLFIYFGYISLYSFVLAVAAHFFRSPTFHPADHHHHIGVFIPSYKEDNVIVDVARKAITQNYPPDRYDVIVIADSLKKTTLGMLAQLPIKVIEVSFDKSTKVRSLNKAFELPDQYDYALILDADNVMENDFLLKVNSMLSRGCLAIQAERTSKNSTTSMSILDGFSERINNFIYRQGHVAIGLPCSLIGSGMIFEYSLVKSILAQLDSVGGFDRELELELIRRKAFIHYAKGALVFDEKVESTEVFEKQRTRWLSSQFIYLRKYFNEGMKALFSGNMAMFNSAILKNIQLPRLVNIGLLCILVIATFFFREKLSLSYYPWLLFLVMNVSAILLAIPARLYNIEMAKSILLLPKLFMKMIRVLFRLRGANKTFIHTPHNVTDSPTNKND